MELLEIFNGWWKEGKISKELALPYKRKVFEHLGKPFIFELKEMAEQIMKLMHCLPKDEGE